MAQFDKHYALVNFIEVEIETNVYGNWRCCLDGNSEKANFIKSATQIIHIIRYEYTFVSHKLEPKLCQPFVLPTYFKSMLSFSVLSDEWRVCVCVYALILYSKIIIFALKSVKDDGFMCNFCMRTKKKLETKINLFELDWSIVLVWIGKFLFFFFTFFNHSIDSMCGACVCDDIHQPPLIKPIIIYAWLFLIQTNPRPPKQKKTTTTNYFSSIDSRQ